MPIYEYECSYCSHKFQQLQHVDDKMPEVCPNCGKKGGVHKLISHASFVLKGSGWYVTDYKNSKNSTSSSEKNITNTASKKNDSIQAKSKAAGGSK